MDFTRRLREVLFRKQKDPLKGALILAQTALALSVTGLVIILIRAFIRLCL